VPILCPPTFSHRWPAWPGSSMRKEQGGACHHGVQSIGITQFLFMGWPDLEEMTYFSRAVLPLVRKNEDEAG
jgi:hypothetical protein